MQSERRSYPDPAPISEIDRLMFGPVDPLAQTNKRLSLALVTTVTLLALSVAGIIGQTFYFQSRPVRVLSMNNAGEVESFLLRTSGFTLHKDETHAALKRSLTDWAEAYYSRLRNPINGEVATLAYPKSFAFLSSDLSQAFQQRESREHNIAGLMSSGDSEYKTRVRNIFLKNLDKKPYEADIYFDRVYYSQPLTVTATKSYLVTIQFSANPADDEIERLRKRTSLDIDSVMRINPLVIAITRISDEQVFNTPQGDR